MQKTKQVLIIASERVIQNFLAEHLSRLGLNCRVANTAKAGMKLLHDLSPDLIIVSDRLSDAKGQEVFKRFKTNGQQQTPMITISYSKQPAELPYTGHLTRPILLTQLKKLVNEFLDTGEQQWQTT